MEPPMHMFACDLEDSAKVAIDMMTEDCSRGSKLALEFAYLALQDDHEAFDPKSSNLWYEFQRWVSDIAAQRSLEQVDRIEREAEWLPDRRMVVWREMTVEKDWIENGLRDSSVGQCWSWDRNYAEAHQGKGFDDPERMRVRLRAYVEPDDIDWIETIALNAAADYTVGDEKEIRLFESACPEVVLVEWATFSRGYSDENTVFFNPGIVALAGIGKAFSLT